MSALQRVTVILSLSVCTFVLLSAEQPALPGSKPTHVAEAIRQRAARDGRVRVIVELKLQGARHVAEGNLPTAVAIAQQRREIAGTADRVLSRLRAESRRLLRRYYSVPYLALDVDANGLAMLEQLGDDVVNVFEDAIARPVLAESASVVQADQVWQAGFDGTGTIVAIVDTGVDAFHPFLTGKVVEEACYSSTVAGTSQSVCPNGLDEQIGAGAAAPCALDDCLHGTHVAGIAAGNGSSGGQPFAGVAKNAQLMAVQVASTIVDAESCGGFPPCSGAFSSDIIAALERVYSIAAARNVVVVNLSLGGGAFSQPCDDSPYKPAIDNLRSIGVASVVASGNTGSPFSIASPACVSTAVSVGSTTKSDEVSWFSDVASFMSLLAPGESITSSVPGSGYAVLSGTSMAAPHVAGVWALMREAVPSASVGTLLTTLKQTGRPVVDRRFFGSVTVPRVNAYEALASMVPLVNPAPAIVSVAPASIRAGLGPATITIHGTGFNAFTTGLWNGQSQPTQVVSTSALRITLSSADFPQVGTGHVSVVAPSPGGGMSASLPVAIDPPPTLSVSETLVGSASPLTVTLADGFGEVGDWLGLFERGTPDNNYLRWTYVGTGITDRTWTITGPTVSGVYEFRLLLGSGNVRVATSAPITVDISLNPVPTISAINPSTAFAGTGPLTLSVTGTGFRTSSKVRWNGADRPTTFVSATQLRAVVDAADVAAVGTAQVSVFTPSPGGGTTPGLAFAVVQGPTLTVSASAVAPGASVTTTLTNGLGGSSDWLALALEGSSNGSYLQWTYIGAGLTSRTWTVKMPTASGRYEFRVVTGNNVRAATSPVVTVDVNLTPPPTVASLSPTTAFSGNGALTLTVNGSGFSPASVVRWNGADRATTFVSSTQVRAAVLASDTAIAGTAQIAVYNPPPGGGVSVPVAFPVVAGPTLVASATLVAPGTNVTVHLSGGLGGSGDWLALASASSPNTSYLLWTYVGAGVTTRSWTVKMPATAGTYEFRLMVGNPVMRAATSAPIVVDSTLNPTPTLTSVSPNMGFTGVAPLTLTLNGTAFSSTSVATWNGVACPTTFVSATQLRAVISAGNLASPGVANVAVFTPAPGGGTTIGVPFTVHQSPTLTVSTTTAAPGANVTVTVTNGLGGSTDWLALAPTSAGNGSYLLWTYVGAGITTRTWTIKMPATPGTYEFRYFINNSQTRAATSAVITVPGS